MRAREANCSRPMAMHAPPPPELLLDAYDIPKTSSEILSPEQHGGAE